MLKLPSLYTALLLLISSYWLLSRWTFTQQLRQDIYFANNIDVPQIQRNEARWPIRQLNDTLYPDTSLAFTSIFSDALRHASNMHDIASASGPVRVTAYRDDVLKEIRQHLLRTSSDDKLNKFYDALREWGSLSDLSALASNVTHAFTIFPLQCWKPYTREINYQWSPSFATLSEMHDLWFLSQNATDFENRFRIAQEFRRTQRRLETLSYETIDNAHACYRPFSEHLEKHVLPSSRHVVSLLGNLLRGLDDAIHWVEEDIRSSSWFKCLDLFGLGALSAMHADYQAMNEVRPALLGFLSDVETVHTNLDLMARYSQWLLSRPQSYVQASLSHPPDLSALMTLINDMETNYESLKERSLSRAFIVSPGFGSPRKAPSLPSPPVIKDLVVLGLWCT